MTARGRSARRTGVIASTAAHGAVVWAILSGQAPRPSIPKTPEEPVGIQVTLVGRSVEAAGSVAAAPLEQIRTRFETPAAVPLPATNRPAADLSELLGDHSPQPTRARSAAAGTGEQRAGATPGAARGDVGDQVSVVSRGGGLGQGGPCWRRRPQGLVDVQLTVTVNGNGELVGPPRIVRARGGGSAEAQAMRALAGCAPYAVASAAGVYRSYELDFAKARDWIRFVGNVDVR